IGHNEKRIAHRIEIVERLTHTHHHDIGDAAFAARYDAIGWPYAARPIAQPVACGHHLAHDLSRREISDQALGAGMAEGAIKCAANLTGNTKGAAFSIGDVDAFDLVGA